MTFGEKLSKLRKENNYTQEQLADVLGVSRQSISKWESDIAYPETEKTVKIAKLFACSMDYLLNDDVVEKQAERPTEKESAGDVLKKLFRERKSTKMIFGMPLYHIGKHARGFFAIGLKARGVFSLGLMSKGIVSLGLLSLGIISLGALSLGLFSAGVFALGLFAIGSIAIGLLALGAVALGFFAAGAVSVGLISLGALSVGCFSAGALSVGSFSVGALAIGKYAAVGDHAYGMIAIGKTVAEGSVYSYIGDLTEADIPTVIRWLDANVPQWLAPAKDLFKSFVLGKMR